jgi:hypothetical protein
MKTTVKKVAKKTPVKREAKPLKRKRLTDIGNSKGVILTQEIIAQYGLEGVDIVIEPTAEGILIKPYKPTFQDKVNELRENRIKIYEEMKKQADDKDIQAYYKNPNNTPLKDIDNEIL